MIYSVAQLGARMHYAVPRILSEAGLLDRLYMDFCASNGWPRLFTLLPPYLRPASIRRMLGRVPEGIPSSQIVAFNGLGREYAARRRQAVTPTAQTSAHLWASREFCRLSVQRGFGSATGIYCFNSAGLELLQLARRSGRKGISEQTIAPKRIETELLMEQRDLFGDWETAEGRDLAAGDFIEREEAEWEVAHLILCGSEFVREGILRCGGPVEKCVVVPYGVDSLIGIQGKDGSSTEIVQASVRNPDASGVARSSRAVRDKNQPLRVLIVGAIGLRKGSPYVLKAAKLLKGKAVFRMVGGIGVTRQAESKLRDHVELTGAIPRSEVPKHFAWADVLLLPSLCEGSATVTYEALAHGLPVICTPNAGSVVTSGVDGFIVASGSTSEIVRYLHMIADDPELLKELGANALLTARDNTLTSYGRRLLSVL
jgi:hypothetical protein